MPDIKLEDGMWIDVIESGKKFYSMLNKALKNATYITMVKKHIAPKFELVFKDQYYDDSRRYTSAYEKYPALYEKYANDKRILTNFLLNPGKTEKMLSLFGLDNVRDFAEEFKLSLIQDRTGSYAYTYNPFSTYSIDYLLKEFTFDYRCFRDYVLYQSVRMEYGCNMEKFWQDWYDTLKMQQRMYGKIKEKYPDDLPTYHQKLSYKSIINQEQIDAARLERVVEKLSKYDMKVDDFIFMCPKSQQDMTEEATQQANCLASYIQKYINGESEIFFMRKKDEPELSYITIERYKGDKGYELRQIYYACNKSVSLNDRNIAEKWIARCEKIDKGEKIKDEEKIRVSPTAN